MHRVTSAMCGLVLCTWPLLGFAQPAHLKELQGSWVATKAERAGAPADDVVGHRLSFADHLFRIEAQDGTTLYAGNVRVDSRAKPAAIDFELAEGDLAGTVWKGIYALNGDTLAICDNAPDPDKQRPTAFAAESGSGYVLVTFERTNPTPPETAHDEDHP